MVAYGSVDDLYDDLNKMGADFPIPGLELNGGFDDCITDHLIEDLPLDECFGEGEPITIFPNGGGGEDGEDGEDDEAGCTRRLVILTDKLVDERRWAWPELKEFLCEYLFRCRPPVIRIQFHGSHHSMQALGLMKTSANIGAAKQFDEAVDWVNASKQMAPPILFTLDFWYGHPLRKDRLFLV